MSSQPHIHFVTGRLAESALSETVSKLAEFCGFNYSIDVLPITVAALMTPKWIAKHISIPDHATRVIIPGYCDGDLTEIQRLAKCEIEAGPRDLRHLPKYFGRQPVEEDYGLWDIEIIAEINHAPRLELKSLLQTAKQFVADGANVIDVGCDPAGGWKEVGTAVRALRDEGIRVSIDSMDPAEVSAATLAGAELVLSVNSTNREHAPDWGCNVVVIPDDTSELNSLDGTVDWLRARDVPFLIDPILEPIGLGFTESISRYIETRRRYPEASMMMGIGNLTELTDVDSAGVNVVLLAICQELDIHSVLTTEVINWARSSVRECDVARQLVHYSVNRKVPPKRLDERLIMLRDAQVESLGPEYLKELAGLVRDNNFRILSEGGLIHLIGGGKQFSDPDPFVVFDRLAATEPANLDPSHAFYLGYEMCKALIANQLGKEYQQDESLDWGLLTIEEKNRRRLDRRSNRQGNASEDQSNKS